MKGKTNKEYTDFKNIKTEKQYLNYLKEMFCYKIIGDNKEYPKRILEIGCGSGEGIKYLNNYKEYYGLDKSSDSLYDCKILYKDRDNISFLLFMFINSLPFEDEFFDCVILLQVFEHIKDVDSLLKEIKRVLVPMGTLYLTTPNKKVRLRRFEKPFNPFHIKEYNKNELKCILQNHFFKLYIYGVFSSSEIENKLKPKKRSILRVYFLDKLGIKSKKKIYKQEPYNPSKYNIGDFRLSLSNINNSLDFFVLCVK